MPGFLTFLLHLARAARNRQQVVALGELDDHLLRDIGLERSDVLSALAQPRHRDPSRMLKLLCCHSRVFIERVRDGFAPRPASCC
ncbi:DUF1127 domain-containing protein [Microvirga arsenatis]|uniref:DUF1127 domain-containing protein n=1 Tax=Microvirga arsenatis TaxID=2692265 RepID=A0ABW9Z3M9_9HYPH|nr:DUF1127 domain-containing protein [Microvirga arsenatis]NBJ12828.1 DUF1127 domain-containing protein [Microvirga arsenatis]NBJ26687.1 DUF1127 domain-containing protein [Microvirga arsenatis]